MGGTQADEIYRASPQWTKEQARHCIKVWLNEVVKPRCPSIIWLASHTRLEPEDLHAWFNWQRRKTPDTDQINVIAMVAEADISDSVRSASHFLHPAPEPKQDPMSHPLVTMPLQTHQDVASWIRFVRTHREKGKISKLVLAGLVGRSYQTQINWENPSVKTCPAASEIRKIADICGFPEPVIAFDLRRTTKGAPQEYFPEAATSVVEEIRNTGRALSSRCFSGSMVERNTIMFMDRFGCSGTDNATLQAIGDKLGVTRERVRMVIDRQMEFLGSTRIDSHAFDALSNAARVIDHAVTLTEAESLLRPHLGEGLSLEGAIDYGIEIHGKRLPLVVTRRQGQQPLVSPGDLPSWSSQAISTCKAIIRHNGAALANLAWAMTMRSAEDLIQFDDFMAVVSRQAGFAWLDDQRSWFWFGPEEGTNRIADRAAAVLSNSLQALDIEVIYGGIVRQERPETSQVAVQSGSWPPISVVATLLSNHPAFVRKQFNDFYLASNQESETATESAAAAIVRFMADNSGIAARWEITEHLLPEAGFQPVTLSLALATSPMITQLDRGVFGVRGWPINATRLEEAQSMVGGQSGIRTVVVDELQRVTWEGVLTEGAIRNRATTLPAKARPYVPEGRYRVDDDRELVVIEDRVGGLVGHLRSLGAQVGWLFTITIDAPNRVATITTAPPGEASSPP